MAKLFEILFNNLLDFNARGIFKKILSMNKIAFLKKLIYNFQEREEESFYACWERYKDLLNAIPHHGYNTGRILSFFYEGI